MKKIFCIIVLFISVVFSGAAQTTKDKIQDNFKKGYFFLMDDEGTMYWCHTESMATHEFSDVILNEEEFVNCTE